MYRLPNDFTTSEGLSFVRLFGIEPNPIKRLIRGGLAQTKPLTIEQIAQVLWDSQSIKGQQEALDFAHYLTSPPKPSIFIGLRAGGIFALCDRQYFFAETDQKGKYSLCPQHYVAPSWSAGMP